MARRGQSPTELVVHYFMTGDLVAVEQALVIASSILRTRRERETSAALGSTPRKRVRKPSTRIGPMIGTSPGVQEAAKPAAPVVGATQQAAAAQSPRRRTRPVAVPPDGAPKRRRGRPTGSKNVAQPAPAAAVDPAPVVPATALPDQGDEPIVE